MTRHLVEGIGYEIRRGGHGPPVLFLHGFTGRGRDWAPFLMDVHAAGLSTVVADLLGHGRSDVPRDPGLYAIERQARAFAWILRGLEATPAVIVGYSMGARIALQVALDDPPAVAGLILESPSAGIADPAERATRRAKDEALALHLEVDGLQAFLRTWEANPVFLGDQRLPRARRDRIRRDRAANTIAGLAGTLRGAGQGAMEPLHDRLHEIHVPTLVLAGSLDPVGSVRARAVADAIPGSDLELLPHLGHAPHRERPAVFRRILIDRLIAWRPIAA